MLAPLSVSQLSKIANNLEQRSFNDGESIIAQGDVGEAFYIVFNGECAVFVAGKADAVATLSKGQYFGERALLTSEPRTATVRAKVCARWQMGAEVHGLATDRRLPRLQGSCEVFSMERKVFVQLLGPVENVLRSEAKKRDEATRAAASVRRGQQDAGILVAQPICCVTQGRAGVRFEEFANLSLDDFRVKRTLGLGAFGRVRLVEVRTGRSPLVEALVPGAP